MHLIDVSPELGEQALVTLAAHVPLTLEIGRPTLATAADGAVMLMTTAGTWWVRPGQIERETKLPDGRVERVAWTGGVELYRVIDGR